LQVGGLRREALCWSARKGKFQPSSGNRVDPRLVISRPTTCSDAVSDDDDDEMWFSTSLWLRLATRAVSFDQAEPMPAAFTVPRLEGGGRRSAPKRMRRGGLLLRASPASPLIKPERAAAGETCTTDGRGPGWRWETRIDTEGGSTKQACRNPSTSCYSIRVSRRRRSALARRVRTDCRLAGPSQASQRLAVWALDKGCLRSPPRLVRLVADVRGRRCRCDDSAARGI
jgi:hypothetical protein